MPFLGASPSAAEAPKVIVSISAPTEVEQGDMWWNSELGQLKIYYVDEDGSQWVDATGTNVTLDATLSFPFYNSTSTLDSIQLISNQNIPFFKSNGTQSNITVTT